MNTRPVFWIAVFAVIISFSIFAGIASAERRPNIVFIMADDLGYECLGTDGGTSYKTPVLDRLAAQGIRFDHCYSQPLCTPTRVKLMTGMYNVRNYVRFTILDRDQTTFAHLFKKAGYATCVVGKWQLGSQKDSPRHFGFDESCLWQHMRGRARKGGFDTRYASPNLEINGRPVDYRDGQYGPDVVSDYACDFMERHRDRPFMLYYPMILTHCPFRPTPDSADWDANDPGSKIYKGQPKSFGDMVAYMDKLVGKIVNKLDDLGLRDNTLVVFTGDNGTDQPIVSMMGDRRVFGGKRYMTDAGTHVPLIANWPGVIPPGQVSDDLVDFSDFLPTLCQAAGIAVPKDLKIDGRSFYPQLLGKKGNPREWVYCWFSRTGRSSKLQQWARNQRYKLYGNGKFYDMSKDRLEKHNLSEKKLDAPAHEAKAMLQGALEQYKNARPAKYQRD